MVLIATNRERNLDRLNAHRQKNHSGGLNGRDKCSRHQQQIC